MKKKIVTLSLIVALLAIVLVGGSLAFFTDTDKATNVITMGNVKISLDEAEVSLDTDGEYVASDSTRVQANTYENVYPGMVLPKDPTVHNDGSMDAFVRVKVAFPVIGTDANQAYYDVEDLFAISGDNFVFGTLDTYDLTKLFTGFDSTKWDVAQTAFNTTDTVLELTFTLKEALAKDADAVLFTAVNVNDAIDTSVKVQMDITGEAVQTAGFANAAEAFDASFDAK